MEGRLGLSWGLSSVHGWGVFGINLVRELLRHADQGWPRPLLLRETPLNAVDTDLHSMLMPLVDEQARLVANSAHLGQVGLVDTLLLHASGNGLIHNETSARFRGARNVGFTFFEETAFTAQAIASAKTFDAMRTGSNWNTAVLRAHGIADVSTVHQGVDTGTFRPRPSSGAYKGRFVIFSGGKFEFRKGQDLVVAAFKAFHNRHPDALLLSVWHNPWPESVATMGESGHIRSVPSSTDATAETMTTWTSREGVPTGAHINLGPVANTAMPLVLREADAALFPNRAEGGTNLVAMECMASGIPCVMSMNTGHLDIATAENSFPLTRQGSVIDPNGCREGWGESDIEEIVQRLEEIYTDRKAAAARADVAVDSMRQMTWETQVDQLLRSLT